VDKETIMKARESGATYFIAKPFDMKNVVERVRKLIPQN
jgi:DNA-binding response OmpR family regulator